MGFFLLVTWRQLIENVIHYFQVTGQLAIWILKGLWIIFCFILKMNFVASIMNPIYVLIFWALETHSSGRRPLTPEPNKEITCFLIRLPIFYGRWHKTVLYFKGNWWSIKYMLYNVTAFPHLFYIYQMVVLCKRPEALIEQKHTKKIIINYYYYLCAFV